MNHHHAVPFQLLRDVPSLACGDAGSGNLIVQGDNLTALKALLPYYAGQVKCIYIDPPYNTGNERWAYNDNVNSSEIRRWLGQVVGKEGETLDRHDRWLCMMYPRLALLRQFLREDGVIFVSIDEIELNHVLSLMDEIWGRRCRLAVFTWVRKKKGSNLSKELRKITEYVVAYKAGSEKLDLNGVPAYAEKMVPLLNRANPESKILFPAGKVLVGRGISSGRMPAGLRGAEKGELAVFLENDILVSDGAVTNAFTVRGRWRWSQSSVDHELASGSTFVLSKDFRINVSRYNQAEKFKAPESLLSPEDGMGTNEDASDELRALFADSAELPFDFPKPSSLLEFLIRASTNPGDLVLDSFAGSGTTGHAVLKMNAAQPDKPARRFILVEMEPKIARDVTAERVRRVAQGYTNAKGEPVSGLGGGFRFCELGEPLYDEAGHIRSEVKFADLARHVYFAETGEPLPRERVHTTPLLGVHRGRAVCLLYNGILRDKSPDGGNALTHASLSILREACGGHSAERIVVYGTSCRLSAARRQRERIEFKQIPYQLQTP